MLASGTPAQVPGKSEGVAGLQPRYDLTQRGQFCLLGLELPELSGEWGVGRRCTRTTTGGNEQENILISVGTHEKFGWGDLITWVCSDWTLQFLVVG